MARPTNIRKPRSLQYGSESRGLKNHCSSYCFHRKIAPALFAGITGFVTFAAVLGNTIVSAVASSLVITLLLYFVWMFAVWDRRSVVIPIYRKDAKPPWYATDQMKIGIFLAILAVDLKCHPYRHH